MFGMNSLAAMQPSELMKLVALANLAPGGGINPPLPANSAAGGQDMGAMPPPKSPQPGMFGAGNRQTANRMAPDGLPYGPSSGAGIRPQQPAPQSPQEAMARLPQAGGGMNMADVPSFASQGDLGPPPIDQFALGRDLANASHVDPIKEKAYKGLFPGKDWVSIVGILADAVAGGFGGTPQFGPMMMRKREAEQEHNRSLETLRARADLERQERMRPRVEQVGNTLGVLNPDPAAFSFNPMYSAPGSAEQYALARGFKPGTEEYSSAVQEYRLGSWSDPALEAKAELEGIRHGYRDELQDERLATSRRNTDVRVGATRRGQDMADSRTRRGQDMTDSRVRSSASFQGKGGKGKGAAAPAANSDLVGPVYVRGKVRVQFSQSKNKYVPIP